MYRYQVRIIVRYISILSCFIREGKDGRARGRFLKLLLCGWLFRSYYIIIKNKTFNLRQKKAKKTMRVWDIHPAYLSDKSLLGEHVEIHALYNIISGGKKGYSQHPETKRWTGHLQQLVSRHNLVIKEMLLREFKHKSPLSIPTDIKEQNFTTNLSYVDLPARQFAILYKKYLEKNQAGRIPLPGNKTEFWAQHKYSIMARGYQYYKEVQSFMKNSPDLPILQAGDLISKIQYYFQFQVPEKALENTILHLWGYFKKDVNTEEKKHFFNLQDSIEKINFLFTLAKKYQKKYLLHSTIFADFLSVN